MAKKKQNDIIWQDRKRWLGLPWTFTRYSADNNRLYVRKGFFHTQTTELLLYRVLDISSSRTLGQKLCGVGTVSLYAADRSDTRLDLVNIRHCEEVRRFFSEITEQRRNEKGITGREIYGSSSVTLAADFADIDGDGVPDRLD